MRNIEPPAKSKINGRQGATKWPTGSGKGSNPRILAALINMRLIIFKQKILINTSIAAPGGHLLTASNAAPPAKSKMADGVWKGVQP